MARPRRWLVLATHVEWEKAGTVTGLASGRIPELILAENVGIFSCRQDRLQRVDQRDRTLFLFSGVRPRLGSQLEASRIRRRCRGRRLKQPRNRVCFLAAPHGKITLSEFYNDNKGETMFSFRVAVHKDKKQVGTIQYHDVVRRYSDGSMKIPVTDDPLTWKWAENPDGFVSEKVVKQIHSCLERGQIVGHAGDEGEYEWVADER